MNEWVCDVKPPCESLVACDGSIEAGTNNVLYVTSSAMDWTIGIWRKLGDGGGNFSVSSFFSICSRSFVYIYLLSLNFLFFTSFFFAHPNWKNMTCGSLISPQQSRREIVSFAINYFMSNRPKREKKLSKKRKKRQEEELIAVRSADAYEMRRGEPVA